MNVSEFLLARLKSLGVDHLFGIPGDYILPFFEILEASDVQHIAPCNELNGGYAADGYARLRGLGAIAVTYGPGSFSVVNAVAAAYAERSPVVVISGGPPLEAYGDQRPMHHVLPDRYAASMRIFEQITVGAKVLQDAESAVADIDGLLELALQESRPVFIEFPRDLQLQDCGAVPAWSLAPAPGDPAATAAAVDLLTNRLRASKRCVLLVGHEAQAFGLEQPLRELIEHTGVAFASIFSGRADFLAGHPQCVGLYHGLGTLEPVREYVEGADTVIWFGAVASDFNLGGSTAQLTPDREIRVFDDQVHAAEGSYAGVRLADVIAGLREGLPAGHWSAAGRPTRGYSHLVDADYVADPGAKMTSQRFYDRMATFFEPHDILLGDAGPIINMAHVEIPPGARYITSGYWASIGGGFGMALGACIGAAPEQRLVALEGDGSFQMTAQELSTMVRYGKTPLIFLMNNKGYTAERLIHDGEFNDIQDWQYWRLAEIFGGIAGCEVRTEGDLEDALVRANEHRGPGPLVIEVHLDPLDVSDAFERMSAGLRSR